MSDGFNFSPDDVVKLTNLFSNKPDEVEDEMEIYRNNAGSVFHQKSDAKPYTKIDQKNNRDKPKIPNIKDKVFDKETKDNIFEEEDLQNKRADVRPQPEYTLTMKQNVGTEDVYLGMSEKSTGSFDCDEYKLSAILPGCVFKEVSLDIDDNKVILNTPKHQLEVQVPLPINEEKVKAKFITDKETLEVYLPLIKKELWDKQGE